MEAWVSEPHAKPHRPTRSRADRAPEADARAILNRLMTAIAENDGNVDGLAQAFCVITAETFGGLSLITLLNRHNETLHVAGVYDVEPEALKALQAVLATAGKLAGEQRTAAAVIRSGEPVLLKSIPSELLNAVHTPELDRYMAEVGIETAVVVPLKGRNGNLGVAGVTRRRGGASFTEDDLSVLTDMSRHMAIALDNLLLVNSLRGQVAEASTAQAALSASEERFRSVFASTSLGIEIMDPVGTLLDTNQAFERMTGFSRAALAGSQFGLLQHPDDAEAVLRVLTEVKMTGEAAGPIENRIVKRDGGVLWVRTSFTAVREHEGGLQLLVAMHEDITSRKETEQYFQAVLEATPEALVMVDAQGHVMLVNRQMEDMFGYTREELLGRGIEMLVPERLRERHPLLRKGYLAQPHTRPMGADLELYAVKKDGAEIPVEIGLSPLKMDNATVVVAAIRDVTERMQRQAALMRSRRSLAEAQRVARLGSLEFEIATGTLEASDEALRIFGIAREDLKGAQTIRERVHPDDLGRLVSLTESVVGDLSPKELEYRVVHPDGSTHIVHDRVAVIPGPDGNPARILGTVQDVTERKQAEREMTELKSHLQSSVELERLRLAQDLHDGPMQELYGASYRLDELGDGAGPDLQQALQDVNEQIQSCIHSLRAVTKELRPPTISSFGLEMAIRSYVDDFLEKHPNIQLDLSLAQDRQMLPENIRITLFRVFQQALANVLRHSHASQVQVRFMLDAEEVRLVVSDNGKGFTVPPNWMSFVRHGHYGLAGAAERVNALGGILLVESHPEQATTITAIVPWTPEQN